MRIAERRVGDATVIDVSGRMTVDDSAGRVKDKVKALVLQGHRRIVLNMSAVTYVDSSGLGELVAAHVSATRSGSSLKIANPGSKTLELLTLTKLLTLFESHPSESAAIESFTLPT